MYRESIEQLYDLILGRSADPVGLAEKIRKLETQQSSIPQIAAEMIASDEFKASFEKKISRAAPNIG